MNEIARAIVSHRQRFVAAGDHRFATVVWSAVTDGPAEVFPAVQVEARVLSPEVRSFAVVPFAAQERVRISTQDGAAEGVEDNAARDWEQIRGLIVRRVLDSPVDLMNPFARLHAQAFGGETIETTAAGWEITLSWVGLASWEMPA